jgi:hypothetical protein
MKITALKQMGFEKADGNAARLLSALRNFGLIEEVGEDRLKLTQRGVDIVARQPGEPQRVAAIRAAAPGPQIYRELLAEFAASGIPPDAALKSELVAARKFNPNSVDGFIEDFRDTLEFAGISDSKMLGLDREHEETDQPPQVGDYVQWESRGQLQFKEPKQIKGFSDDGEWAFLEGSPTGVPVKELTVSDPPPDTPLMPPALKGKVGSPPPSPFPIGRTPGASAMRQDIFSLEEGPVTIQWPAALSGASFEDLSAWLDILKRKIGRSVEEPEPEYKQRARDAHMRRTGEESTELD